MSKNKTEQRPGFRQNQRASGLRVTEKPKNFRKSFIRLVKYLGNSNKLIILAVLISMASSIFTIFGPRILGKATTNIFESIMQNKAPDYIYIGHIVLFLFGLYVVSSLLMYIQGFMMTTIAQNVSYAMRKSISEKIEKLPMKYYDKKKHGEILSIVTNDVDTVSSTLNQSLPLIASSVTMVLGVLVMMLTISVVLTVFTLIAIPMSLFLIRFIANKSQKYFKRRQDILAHVNGHIEEMYGSHSVMKAFNGEEEAISKFNEGNEKLYDVTWKAEFLSDLMMPVVSFVTNMSYVVVAILGGWLAIKKAVTVGDIQAFIQYVRSFNMPLTQTAQIAGIIQSTTASAERVFEFLEEEEETSDPQNPIKLENINGFVDFKNVKFGYSKEHTIIHDFSVNVKPGQHIAIVGPTGAGKSTLIKLLLRFYELQDGSISIDGHNITQYRKQDLRKIFGIVLQDTWLFNGTIMENIRYGRLDATDEDVINAARAACADDFIRSLPNSYNMVINEDASNISQGQMQLLTIARAILANPFVLILDEATSSVDTRTEVLIQKAMTTLMQGKTSFIIAHRLSTIKDADLILVVNNGDIIEQGTHEELLAFNGFYKSLYDSQFENV